MSVKHKRVPKGKPGQLMCVYGHHKSHGNDLYFVNGEGVSKPDSHFLYGVIAGPRLRRHFDPKPGEREFDYGPSLAEELEARGYDITTLRFSIQKKVVEVPK